MRKSNDPIWKTTDRVVSFYKKSSGNWQMIVEEKSGSHGGMFQPKQVLKELAAEWGIEIEIPEGE